MGELFQFREFTDYEKKFIAENCSKMTVGGLRTALNIPWQTIYGYLKRNGLSALDTPRRPWSKDLAQLQEYLNLGYSDDKIAELMNRTPLSIEQTVRRFNLKRKRYDNKQWTASEDEFLCAEWGRLKIRTLAMRLGRTITAVKLRASRLNLPPSLECEVGVPLAEFCKIIGVSRDRIDRWRLLLGFPIRESRLTERRFYYVVDIDKALLWMEKHQEEFDASKIEQYGLTVEPKWLVAKRRRDASLLTKEDRKKAGLRTTVTDRESWTTGQDEKLLKMCAARASTKDIAYRLNKTVCAIEARIREKKIPYLHPKFYSDEEKDFIEAHYKDHSYAWMAQQLGRKSVGGLRGFCFSQGWYRGKPHS